MIDFKMDAQPDDESCGPTCLHAVYKYYGLDITYQELVKQVERSLSGGTLAPMLGKHALQSGFKVTLFVNNLQLYDPTWFNQDGSSNPDVLSDKLIQQVSCKKNRHLTIGTHSVLDFLSLGGTIYFRCMAADILRTYLERGVPIITGLSSTYLYNCSRELFTNDGQSINDDVRGQPCGHFVVLCGYNNDEQSVVVADPFKANPVSGDNYYTVSTQRLINAIMLGIVTRDGNLLIVEQKT